MHVVSCYHVANSINVFFILENVELATRIKTSSSIESVLLLLK